MRRLRRFPTTAVLALAALLVPFGFAAGEAGISAPVATEAFRADGAVPTQTCLDDGGLPKVLRQRIWHLDGQLAGPEPERLTPRERDRIYSCG